MNKQLWIPKIGDTIRVRCKQSWNIKGYSDKKMKVSFYKGEGYLKCNECGKQLEKGEIQAVSSGIHVCWNCAVTNEIT